jgi:amino acid adenylation domain-containing protein
MDTLAYKLSPQQRIVIKNAAESLKYSMLQFCINETNNAKLKLRINLILDQYSSFKLNFIPENIGSDMLQTIGDTVRVQFYDRDLLPEDLKIKDPASPLNPLLQIFILEIPSGFQITLLSHPLCADLSGLLLLQEKISENDAQALISEEISYIQFSEWQNQLLVDDGAKEGFNFWQQQLNEASFRLKIERQTNNDSAEYNKFFLKVPAILREAILLKAKQDLISVESIFFATFLKFIGFLSVNRELSIGFESNGREFEELNGTMGLLSKLLPFSLNETIGSIDNYDVKNIEEAITQHRSYQFFYLQQETVKFDYQFGFLNTSNIAVTEAAQLLNPAKIKCQVVQSTEEITCNFIFDTRYFSDSDINYVAEFMLAIAQDLVRNTSDSIELLRVRYNSNLSLTANLISKYTDATDVVSRFRYMANLFPDQLAVKTAFASFTYQQIDELSDQIGRALHNTFKIEPGDFVGIILDEDEWLPIGMLAVLKAGATYIPIDASNPLSRLKHILTDSAPVCILTNLVNAHLLSDTGISLALIHELLEVKAKFPNNLSRSTDQAAYMIYTSGTTGLPKGVIITDSNLLNYVDWFQQSFNVNVGDQSLLQASYAYDLGYTSLWGCLLTGATLHILPTSKRQEADELVKYIKDQQLSFLKLTPSLFYLLLKAENIEILKDSALRLILLGGEKIDTKSLQHFADIKKEIVFVNHYGPTETTIGTIYHIIQPGHIDEFIEKPIIGRPISNAEVYILNADGNPCLPGEIGEICIGGKGVAKGYHQQEKLNFEKFFVFEIAGKSIRLYRSGDLGYWSTDQHVCIEGRIDDQVKIRGHRIELSEIKLSLDNCGLSKHILRVIASPDYGEELVCYYQLDKDADILRLRTQLLHFVPEYMIPAFFIRISSIPLTANGKTDYRALPDPYKNVIDSEKLVTNLTATETLIAEIWTSVLHQQNLTPESDFFLLGGDSIKAIQIIAKINRQGLKCLLADIFNYTSIGKLAQHLEAEASIVSAETVLVAEHTVVNYCLSPMQEAMYFHYKAFPESKANIIIRQFEVAGKMNTEAFQKAVQQGIDHYDILRIRFCLDESNTPIVQIRQDVDIKLDVQDLSRLSVEESEIEINQTRKKWIEQGFDLEKDLPIRIKQFDLAGDKQVILLAYHHIIMDGWCFNVIIKEIMSCYQALCNHVNYQWPPYTSFTKYLEWIEQLPRQDSILFWKNYLKDYTTLTSIPYLDNPIVNEEYDPALLNLLLSKELTKTIQQLCNEKKTTMNVFFQTAWGILLTKYNDTKDAVVGITVAGRPYELDGFENMVGLFINTLPLRVKWSDHTTVDDLLSELTTFLHEYQSHQYLTLPEIQSCSSLNKNLLNHLLVFENYPLSSVEEESDNTGIKIESKNTFGHASYPLAVIIYPGEQVHISFTFDKNHYSQDWIEKLSIHFHQVIKQIAEASNTLVSQIDMVTKEEKEVLLKWSYAAGSFDQGETIVSCFQQTCALYKDNVALDDGQQSLTYQQIGQSAKELAQCLTEKYDIKPGDRIGIYLPPSVNIPVVIFGILYCGAAYVPIDVEYPAEKVAFIATDSNCRLIITSEELSKKLQLITKINLLAVENIPSASAEAVILPTVAQNDLAYVIYTSGSTGQSKGCLISHLSLMNLLKQKTEWLSFNSDDVWIMAHSYAFDFSVWEIFGSLLNGGRLYIPQRDEVRDTNRFYEIIEQAGVTILNQTPGAFYPLLERIVSQANSLENLSLRMVIFGGDKLDFSKLKSWIKIEGSEYVQLFNLYGITEITVHATWHLLTQEEIINTTRKSVIGLPIPGTSVYVVNDQFQLCPVGVQGELVVSGNGVFMGYHNRPELMAQKLMHDPFTSGKNMYRSGDFGRWLADGTLEYLGRKDDQIQVRGFRVELGEIIYHLQKHAKISKAFVIAKEAANADLELIAYLLPVENSTPYPEVREIRNFLAEIVPAHLIPHHFVFLDEIPLNSNGKIDKEKLPLPSRNTNKNNGSNEVTDLVEQTVLDIWKKELDMDDINVNDNFFDLGGHSLKAVRLMSEVQKQFSIILPLVQLYKDTTVLALSATIRLALQKDLDVVDSDYLILKEENADKTLFFLPPAVGYAIGFAALARQLVDCTVYGLNFMEQDTLQSMANYVQKLQPQGEIILCGFSAGGSMCFHVAKILEASGRKIRALILLDSRRFIEPEPLTEQEVVSIADEYLADPRAKVYLTSVAMMSAMRKRIEASTRFIHQLKDDGKINADIFYISSETNRNNTDRKQAWQEITNGQLYVYDGSGPHASMLNEPFLVDNVRIYQEVLKQVY